MSCPNCMNTGGLCVECERSMIEHDDEKKIEAAADKCENAYFNAEEFMGFEVYSSAARNAFKAGVAWARANPESRAESILADIEEVKILVKALEEISLDFDERGILTDAADIARDALAKWKGEK